MAGVRDPAFWKRFSVAVHRDEEQGPEKDLQDSDSWLAKQNAKAGRYRICWLFWPCAILFAGLCVFVIVLVARTGAFNRVGVEIEGSGTTSGTN